LYLALFSLLPIFCHSIFYDSGDRNCRKGGEGDKEGKEDEERK